MLCSVAAVGVVNGNGVTTVTCVSQDVVNMAVLGGCALLCRQFYALFAKRLHFVLRSKKGFLSQVSFVREC